MNQHAEAVRHMGAALYGVSCFTHDEPDETNVGIIVSNLECAARHVTGDTDAPALDLTSGNIQDVPPAARGKYAVLAIEELGMCITTTATLMQQGERPDNQAKIGGIIAGLEKVALYASGKRRVR